MKLCGGGAALLLLLLSGCSCSRPGSPGSPGSPGRRVCQGTKNMLSMMMNHYDDMMTMYSNCTVVLDNLEVTYIQEHQDLSFLQSIQEVGGYVLIALNKQANIPLVNLRLIRGHNLYDDQFALTVMSNYGSSATVNYTSGLKQLQLSSLTEILNGGVRITGNPFLCNTETIDWVEILDQSRDPAMFFKMDNFIHECEECDPGCVHGSCWAPGPDHCQRFTKLQCAEQCSRRCRGPTPSDCCNEHCAAGCTGPRATDCLACRDLNDDGTCKPACPPLTIYDPVTDQMVPNPNAKYTFGTTCVKECPYNYVVSDGSCVCRSGTYEVEEDGVQHCKACDGPCPKVCDGLGVGSLASAVAIDAFNIESFRNCTKIKGNVIFFKISFTGDEFYKVPPMDLDKLEYFRTVKEITGFLLIQNWPENHTSLSVFENLQIIRGRTTRNLHSLLVLNVKHLRWLGLRSLKEVSAGRVLLRDNLQLCYTGPVHWSRLFRSTDQIFTMSNNAPSDLCEQQNQTCDSECTDEGCWGPGPTMCVS